MGFGQSVSSCFSKYATFAGRASRSEFWWFLVFVIIGSLITQFLDGVIGTTYTFSEVGTDSSYFVTNQVGWINMLFSLIVLLPGISVAVRRLHDTDKSGWWWWLGFLCFIGWIVLFIFYVTDSGPDNRFGVNPKGEHIPSPGIPPTAT